MKIDEKALKETIKTDPFGTLVGIEFLEAEDYRAKARIKLETKHKNPNGTVHGGCIFTLIDTVAGGAFQMTGKRCTTVTSTVDYLRPTLNSKELIGEASPVKMGKHILVYDVMIRDDQGDLIARASITYYVLADGVVKPTLEAPQEGR